MRDLTLRCVAALAFMATTTAADTAAFKITFGAKRPTHGRSWSGGIRDASQVRQLSGWHLGVEDKILPPNRWHLLLRSAGGLVSPKAVIVEIASPEEQPVTLYVRYGDFPFVPAEIPYGTIHRVEELDGDVTIERVPASAVVSGEEHENADPSLFRTRNGEYWMAWIGYRTIRREGYLIEGGDSVMVARGQDGAEWSAPREITTPGDHFRAALGEDSQGRLWCVYAARKQTEGGNFDLYTKYFDGSEWSREQQLTTDPLPDIFHRVASGEDGRMYLTWMGFRKRTEDPLPQSDVLLRILDENGWGEEINLSNSPEDDWEPAVSAANERAWIAWDAYRPEGDNPPTYDVLVRSVRRRGEAYVPGPIEAVGASPGAEMRADIASDGAGRVWLTWEEGSRNWGKDTGYENPRHGIFLRPGGAEIYRPPDRKTGFARRPRVAVRDGGSWRHVKAELTNDLSAHLNPQLLQSPRLVVDGGGKVRVILRHQLAARGRNGGHLFDLYATSLSGAGENQHWTRPILLPGSTAGQDSVLASAPGDADGVVLAVVGDGRRLPVGLPEHHEISVLSLPAAGTNAPPETAAMPATAEDYTVTHPEETADVARIRDHRIRVGDRSYKIIRGDLHRHSEISMDGATDGSLWDLYRYALNGASMDFFAITDHNYGAWLDTDEPESANTDDVYQWWRTQKSADLFHVPGRFVPLYGYERSVNFPRGHVNIFHPRRGVFSYRVPKLHIQERPELVEKDAIGLGEYLRDTGGVGIAHTSGSIMGTDWNLHDDSVIPLVEIYQGDRNSYEEQGAPRAAVPESLGLGMAGRQPFQKGLVRNALGAGFRLGFIASSDHFSTHISYANLIVPEGVTNRQEIQDALQSRRTYASTDNIVLDFRAGDALQGSRIETSESPSFEVAVSGTAPVMKVEVIKNNQVVYTHTPDGPAESRREVSFTYRDTAFQDTSMARTSQISRWDEPETGVRPRQDERESYYYVRVVQSYSAEELTKNGEVAWSSPIFVRNSR